MVMDEVLNYEFKPVGLKVKTERRECVKVENELYKVFKKWLDEFKYDVWWEEKNYEKAVNMLKNIKPTIDEAHSALIAYEDHSNIKYAGLFVSAVYNLVEDKIIVFDVDLDVDINYLGYKLGKGKILVNYGGVGDFMGYWVSGVVINYGKVGDSVGNLASGVVINYGKVGDSVGNLASGVVINYGKVGDWMGFSASGVMVNYGKVGRNMCWNASGKIISIKNPASFGYLKNAELVLDEEECRKIPGLIEYFDELKNKLDEGRNNPELLLGIFGDNPSDKIKEDISKLIKMSF
jgi:hypothetical protein